MWQFDRPTTRRVARCSAMRTRVCRARRDRASFLFMLRLPGNRSRCSFLLGFLDHHALVDIADTLALVRLGRPPGANLRGRLPDALLVDALDHDFRLLGSLDLDSLRHHLHDRMREAEREVDPIAGGLSAVADADQRELLLEAPGHSGHHVGDQRADRSVHRPDLLADRLEDERVAFLLDRDLGAEAPRHGAKRPLDGDLASGERHLDLRRQLDRVVADARHGCAPAQATMQSTSPPTPLARALRSVITPCDVDTMAMPSPFMTRGMSSLPL